MTPGLLSSKKADDIPLDSVVLSILGRKKMNVTELPITISVLIGLTMLRFGIPLLVIWLIKLALLKLAPPPIKTI